MNLAARAVFLLSLTGFACLLTVPPNAFAQSSGSRGGVLATASGAAGFPMLDQETAERYIMIEGSAEVRVRPTDIRVVLAVTNEADTAKQCHEGVAKVTEALQVAWSKMQIPSKDIVVDFIAVLPRYEWTFESVDGKERAIERKAGYRMQTNVHLAVHDESVAQRAVAMAFEQGVTDIIAFDYWSADVDEAKVKATERAIEVALRKAELLLIPLVDKPLPVINVQEHTQVLSPKSLYQSFVNSYEDTVQRPARRDLPLVSAYRPQNTYYHGPQLDVDTQSPELPMNPEISVVAQVRIYFESPAARNAAPIDNKKD